MMYLYIILIKLAFGADPLTDGFNKSLLECSMTKSSFNEFLNKIEKDLEVKNNKSELNLELSDSVEIRQLVSLLAPYLLPKHKANYTLSCWTYYYEFKKEMVLNPKEATESLKKWRVCLDDAYKSVPALAHDISNCYTKILDKK
jgi:hypothetical protein